MDLVIDHRERRSRFVRLAVAPAVRTGEVRARFAHLPVGDYLVDSRLLVERKTEVDLRKSIISSRLFRQARSLSLAPLEAVFLVEGSESVARGDFRFPRLQGAVVSLMLFWRLPVLYAPTPAHSLTTMRLVSRQLARRVAGPSRSVRRASSTRRMQTDVLRSFPGIGAHRATALLQHFGSLRAVLNASEHELREVKGMGAVNARKMVEWLDRGVA